MTKIKIIILTDGDYRLGLGHLYRTKILVNTLKKLNQDVLILTKSPIVRKIFPKTFKFKIIKNNPRLLQKNIQSFNPDIFVIDKLQETKTTLKILKIFKKPIVGIDYIGNNKKLIDCGINILYPLSGVLNPRSYSGFKYNIINEKFHNTKPIRIHKNIYRVLVLQGGSDTRCYTPKIIEGLSLMKEDIKITIVLGRAFKCWNRLKKILAKNVKPVKIHQDVNNLPSLMVKHDLAITAGGNILLELAQLGIPSIVVCGEKFELETTKLLQKKGFGINLGYGENIHPHEIALCTSRLLDNYELRRKMNKVGKGLIDGKGKNRIAYILSQMGSTK